MVHQPPPLPYPPTPQAYKLKISSRRGAYKDLDPETMCEDGDATQISLLSTFKESIQRDIECICREVIGLLDHLIEKLGSILEEESKVILAWARSGGWE